MNKAQLYAHCKAQEEEIQRLTLFNDGNPYSYRSLKEENKKLKEENKKLKEDYHDNPSEQVEYEYVTYPKKDLIELVNYLQKEMTTQLVARNFMIDNLKEENKKDKEEIKFQKKIFKSIVLQAIRNDNDEEFLDDGGHELIRYSDYLAESPEDFKKVEIFMKNIMLSLNCDDLAEEYEEEMSFGYKNGNLFISFDDTSDEEDESEEEEEYFGSEDDKITKKQQEEEENGYISCIYCKKKCEFCLATQVGNEEKYRCMNCEEEVQEFIITPEEFKMLMNSSKDMEEMSGKKLPPHTYIKTAELPVPAFKLVLL